jgi:PAS domain S-box-containing protein
MNSKPLNREQMVKELARLRRRVGKLERSEADCHQANEALRESEARFRQFFELEPAYCYMVSPKGIILDVNRAARRTLGYKKKELIGQPLKIIYAAESQSRLKSFISEWKKTGRLRNKEMVIISRKGEKRTVLLNTSSLKDTNGKILHSISVQQDITERKKIEDKTKHLNSILHSIRSVNLIITKEKDRSRLLRGICKALVITRGYKNAWIALMDDSGNLLNTASAGLGREFSSLVEKLKGGLYPDCVRRALGSSRAVIIQDPSSECPGCPLSYGYKGRKGMSTRLKYGNEVFGVLTVSMSPDIQIDDKEEQSLYREIAQDVSFALYNLQVIEDRQRVRQEIELLSKFPSENPYPVLRIDRAGIIRYANPASSPLLKAWGCRPGRKLPGKWHRLTVDAIGAGAGREAEMICGDRLLLLTFAPVEGADYLNVYGLDITERQKAKEAEQLKKLTESLIDFQEEERKRVARELHDQIGQLLAAIKLHLRMISRDHPDLEESVEKSLEKAGGLLDRAQEDARRIAARLRPDILDDFGLSAAIENEIIALAELSDLDIIFKPGKFPERIDPRKEVALYRVAQEALTNITRHAGATSVTVNLTMSGGRAVLSVRDNGKGFAGEDPRVMRLGILGMRERLESVGGILRIEANPGGGTILEAEIPLEPKRYE